MMIRPRLLLLVLPSLLGLLGSPREAAACAAAPVSASGEIGPGTQRILVATKDGNTEVVVELTVPQTTTDYGVLIPVPARPTLDPVPVDSGELDELDTGTRPQIYDGSADTGGGVGCGSAVDAGNFRGVDVLQQVDIGPLTVVVLTASAANDLSAWLSANSFVIPSGKDAVLDRYTGAGNYFIAARRNDHSAPGTATRIGLHFTLPGTQLTIPLPATQLGGVDSIGVTIFVFTDDPVGSMTPYTPLTLNDLDPELLKSDYRGAIQKGVSAHSGRAFVIEGAYGQLGSGFLSGRLATLVSIKPTLTRLSTVGAPSAFTDDLVLAAAGAPDNPPNNITVGAPEESGCSAAQGQLSGLAYFLAFLGYWQLRRRRS